MHQTILPQAVGKWYSRLGILTLVWQPVYKKENFEFKPIKLCSERPCVSSSSCEEDVKCTHLSSFLYLKLAKNLIKDTFILAKLEQNLKKKNFYSCYQFVKL